MTPSAAEAFWPRPGAVVIECKGERDVTTMEQIGELFTDLVAENELVVIDLTEAEFIDSSFLHNLIKADRLARERGSQVRIQYGQSPIVWRALQLSGVSKSLELVGSRDEALAGVPEQAA